MQQTDQGANLLKVGRNPGLQAENSCFPGGLRINNGTMKSYPWLLSLLVLLMLAVRSFAAPPPPDEVSFKIYEARPADVIRAYVAIGSVPIEVTPEVEALENRVTVVIKKEKRVVAARVLEAALLNQAKVEIIEMPDGSFSSRLKKGAGKGTAVSK